MMFVSQTTKTRLVAPSHEPWVPHRYQERAVEFLLYRPVGALFLDPGLGKTSIVLEAFRRLREQRSAERMLVIAPLRVCQMTWRQESIKWSQFRDFRIVLLHGPRKGRLLKQDADIYLINPEGISWLADQFFGQQLPFDTIVIDELTKFKNHRARRSRKLRPKIEKARRKWGLTGTPAPNGYLDLFGQFLVLDGGVALGKFITHYRDKYFRQDWNGFDYVLREGADEQIEARIAPYVLCMSADDYLDLPELIDDIRFVEMSADARKTYEQMKRAMLSEIGGTTITAANAAACYSKLKQMANGTVYFEAEPGQKRGTGWLHDDKIEALADLVEECGGQQILIGYEFRHDLERLLALFGPETPWLGSGVSEKRAIEIAEQWNAGEIPILLAHPASAGHGLNLQGDRASHIAWFSATWDYELYDQFIRRVHRQGTEAGRIINHIFAVRGTIDELVIEALREKKTTQDRLLNALNAEVLRDSDPEAARDYVAAFQQENDIMVKKMLKKGEIRPRNWGTVEPEDADGEEEKEEAAAEVPAGKPAAPKGWGRITSGDEEYREQRRKIRERISAIADDEEGERDEEEPVHLKARKMFSPEIRKAISGGDEVSEEEEAEGEAEEAASPAAKTVSGTAAQAAGETTRQATPAASVAVALQQAAEIDHQRLGREIAAALLEGLASMIRK